MNKISPNQFVIAIIVVVLAPALLNGLWILMKYVWSRHQHSDDKTEAKASAAAENALNAKTKVDVLHSFMTHFDDQMENKFTVVSSALQDVTIRQNELKLGLADVKSAIENLPCVHGNSKGFVIAKKCPEDKSDASFLFTEEDEYSLK